MIKDDALTNNEKSRKELRTSLWIRLVSIKTDGYLSDMFQTETRSNRKHFRYVLTYEMSRMLLIYFTQNRTSFGKMFREIARRSLYSLYKNNKLRRNVALIFLDAPARRSDAAVYTCQFASDEFLLPHATKSIYPCNARLFQCLSEKLRGPKSRRFAT